MCGIIAFSGNENFDEQKIRQLFLYNASRGLDGCGMLNADLITKSSNEIYDAILKWNIIPEKTFLGHTRKSTYTNYKKEKNCHPFKFSDIVGVHNGTLTNHWSLCNENDLKSSDYDTDSEILIKLISINPEILKKIKGAASIVYTDLSMQNDDRILFCFRKNEERPLFRGKCKEGMYISSLENSLKSIGCTNIEEFKIQYLYQIKDGKILNTRPMLEETEKKSKDKNQTHSDKQYSMYDTFVNDNDTYYSNSVVMHPKESWVRITSYDTTCRDNGIYIGSDYKLAHDVKSGNFYVNIEVYEDLAGFPIDKPRIIMYKRECVEFYNTIKSKDVIAVCMESGVTGVKAGDYVYVYKREFIDNYWKLGYFVVYPQERVSLKTKEKYWSWRDTHFRLATKNELLAIYNKFGTTTPIEITNYIHQCKYQTPIIKIDTTNSGEKRVANELTTTLQKINKLSDEKRKKVLIAIREEMKNGLCLIDAVTLIFNKKDFKDIEKHINSITAEEEDFKADDNDTPLDTALTDDDDFVDIDPEEIKCMYMEVDNLAEKVSELEDTKEMMRNSLEEYLNNKETICTEKDFAEFETTEEYAQILAYSSFLEEVETFTDYFQDKLKKAYREYYSRPIKKN
jgi:hypothetical protein